MSTARPVDENTVPTIPQRRSALGIRTDQVALAHGVARSSGPHNGNAIVPISRNDIQIEFDAGGVVDSDAVKIVSNRSVAGSVGSDPVAGNSIGPSTRSLN